MGGGQSTWHPRERGGESTWREGRGMTTCRSRFFARPRSFLPSPVVRSAHSPRASCASSARASASVLEGRGRASRTREWPDVVWQSCCSRVVLGRGPRRRRCGVAAWRQGGVARHTGRDQTLIPFCRLGGKRREDQLLQPLQRHLRLADDVVHHRARQAGSAATAATTAAAAAVAALVARGVLGGVDVEQIEREDRQLALLRHLQGVLGDADGEGGADEDDRLRAAEPPPRLAVPGGAHGRIGWLRNRGSPAWTHMRPNTYASRGAEWAERPSSAHAARCW